MSTNALARLAFLPVVMLLFAVACGGGNKFAGTVEVDPETVQIVSANTDIVIGENRFAFGLLHPESGIPIIDANVHLRFYELNNGEEFRFEMPAVSRVPARDAGIQEQVQHIHADGTAHTHYNVGEEVGIYTAVVEFDTPGDWGIEMRIEKPDQGINQTLFPRFRVGTQATTPPIGFDAPRSVNLTIHDVDDIGLVDSSANPSEEMHTTTIKEAIEAGRPTLILFAVPGFCTSRLCGPEIEIMRLLYPEWKDRVEFIHVEFFEDPGTNSIVSQPAKDYGLRTEPWFFLVDSQGKVAAKFEGPTTMDELVEAMEKVMAAD